MSGKKTLAAGIIFSFMGILAVVALVILSALFYPPSEWPEGPPDSGPMVGIIAGLCMSSCCLLGPVLLLIGLFTGSASSKKKKGKKSRKKAKKKSSSKKKGKKESSPKEKKKRADTEE